MNRIAARGLLAVDPEMPEQIHGEEWQGYGLLARAGAVWLAGQPTPGDWARFAEGGVTTVVNLRRPEEMADRHEVPFDQSRLLATLGLREHCLPIGAADCPYAPATVDRFAAAMADCSGQLVLHCKVALRVSYLWVAFLIRYHRMAPNEALLHGRRVHPSVGILDELLHDA